MAIDGYLYRIYFEDDSQSWMTSHPITSDRQAVAINFYDLTCRMVC